MNGVSIIELTSPRKLPMIASLIASPPFPSSSSLWAGSAVSTSSAFGAPKNVVGIISRNVCVIAMLVIAITKIIGCV